MKSRGADAKVLKKVQKLAEWVEVFWKIKNFPNLGMSPRFFGVVCARNLALKGRVSHIAYSTQRAEQAQV